MKPCLLITGGSGGIGEAICKVLFNKKIIPIIIFNNNKKKAYELAKKYKGFSLKIDLKSDISIKRSISKIKKILGSDKELMGAIMGASEPPEIKSFSNFESEDFANQYRINVIGPQLLLTKLVKNFFRQKKLGVVIGVLSDAIGSDSKPPITGMSPYVLAKSALNKMLDLLKVEYPWLKIDTVSPSFTDTNMLEVFNPRYLEVLKIKNKILKPEDVAQLIWKKIDK